MVTYKTKKTLPERSVGKVIILNFVIIALPPFFTTTQMPRVHLLFLFAILAVVATKAHVKTEEEYEWKLAEEEIKPAWWNTNGCSNVKMTFDEFARTYAGDYCVASSAHGTQAEPDVLQYEDSIFGKSLYTVPMDHYKPPLFTISERFGIIFELFHEKHMKSNLVCLLDGLIVETVYGADLDKNWTVTFTRRRSGWFGSDMC